jgi:hypothetical protein
MMRRYVVALAVAVLGLSGCNDEHGYDPPPGAPSLLPVWGARETDGTLRISMGSPCTNVKTITVSHNMAGPRLILTSSRPEGASVEYLTVGGPYPGFTVTEQWPAGLDWRSADQLVLQVDGKGVTFGATTRVSDIVDGSPNHPADTYLFEGAGWLNPADVAAKDGKDFATVCTPNPPATAS